jgi:hypothetical protein
MSNTDPMKTALTEIAAGGHLWGCALAAIAQDALGAAKAQPTAKQRYDELEVEKDGMSSLENLRAFCLFAMTGQDWLDVEPFFVALEAAQPVVPQGLLQVSASTLANMAAWLADGGSPNEAADSLRDMLSAAPAPAVEPVQDDPHPPSRLCMCAYCAPSFDDNASPPAPAVELPVVADSDRYQYFLDNCTPTLLLSGDIKISITFEGTTWGSDGTPESFRKSVSDCFDAAIAAQGEKK